MALTTVGADSAPAKTFTISENAARFAGGVAQAAVVAEATVQSILDADLINGSLDDSEVMSCAIILLRRAARDLRQALDGDKPGHDEFDEICTSAGANMYL